MSEEKNFKHEPEILELALQEYEQDQREFENHWVWKQLDTSPREFFEALRERIKQIDVPQEKWLEIYNRVKETHRVRALEKQKNYKKVDFKLMKAIKA